MSLRERLSNFNPEQFRISKPTGNSLGKALAKIERQAEGLEARSLEPPREVIEEVVRLLRLEGSEIPKKSLKLVAAGGVQYLAEQEDGQNLIEHFFQLVIESGSSILMKSLLLGYLRLASSGSVLTDKLRNILIRRINLIPDRWLKRIDLYKLLETPLGFELGKLMLFSKDETAIQVLENAGIKRGLLLGGGFSKEVFNSMVKMLSAGHNDAALNKFFELLEERNSAGEFIYPFTHPQSGDIALTCEALLRPYLLDNPSELIQARIENFLLARFGDPRVNRLRWSKVRGDDVAVLSRWLTKQSFEIIIEVLRKTNNTGQWKERAEFWGHYIKHEFVSEAWVLFGPDAYRLANSLVREGEIKSRGAYAVLERENIQPIHSAILMKIGNLIVSEWTHDGKIRIYNSDNAHKPKFYDTRYYPSDMRDDSTPDFVKVHLGNWEWDVETYIYRYANIPGPRRGASINVNKMDRSLKIAQSNCSKCGQAVPPRWLDSRGICLSCGGGSVKIR